MKNCFLLLSLLAVVTVNSQSRFKLGPYYNFGASTYYGMSGNMMNGTKGPAYSLKPGAGLGATIQYEMTKNLGLCFFSGYQQRGAYFDKGLYSYSPKYRFNYLDIGLGVFYQTKELMGKSKLRVEIAGTYHRLLNSERVNNYEAYNLVNDSKKNDFGALVRFGILVPRAERDAFYISVFANGGFQNVFSGVLADNSQVGKNFLFGLNLSYFFGFNKTVKND